MQILYTHIAGIPHRKPASLPPVGTLLTLVHEPTNAYDPNAIKVMWDAIHLGYIPKNETATVKAFGWTQMRVVEVKPERKWTEVMIEDIPEGAKLQDGSTFKAENHMQHPLDSNS